MCAKIPRGRMVSSFVTNVQRCILEENENLTTDDVEIRKYDRAWNSRISDRYATTKHVSHRPLNNIEKTSNKTSIHNIEQHG